MKGNNIDVVFFWGGGGGRGVVCLYKNYVCKCWTVVKLYTGKCNEGK